jgi:hypothetical protein
MNSRNVFTYALQIGVFIFIFWLLFNPAYLFHENIKGDDASYVAHTFTIALDSDLDYCNEVNFDKKGCSTGKGRTAPSHPIGTGIVHAPIVKLFSVIDILQNHPVLKDRNQYVGSWSFLGLFFSVTCCFIFGILFFINAIESFTDSVPRWLVLLMASGYGVPYYIFQRFTMSHGPEYFTLALIFWSSIKLLSAKGQWKHLLLFLLAASIGLSYLIRPANINVVFIPIMVFLLSGKITGKKLQLMQAPIDRIYLLTSTLIVLLFIISINNSLYQVYFPNSEQMYGFRIGRIPATLQDKLRELWFSIKYIPTIIFSSEFGLVFSAPVLVFGSMAILYFGIDRQRLFGTMFFLICLLIFIGIPLAIVLFWKNTGDAYGYRYLFSIAPISILGLVIFYKNYPGRLFGIPKKLFYALAVFAILGQVFFATSDLLTPVRKMNAFGRLERFSTNDYEISLAKSIVDMKSWEKVMAKRYPGFLAVQVLNEDYIQQVAQKMKLPPDKFTEVFTNIKTTSSVYRLIITIYGIVMPLILWYIIFYRKAPLHLYGRGTKNQHYR